MKKSNLSLLYSGIFAWIACSLMTSVLYAKDLADIPPPSETQPNRIRIPINEAQERISENEDKGAAEDEIAAFAIAVNANGWIPENSSGRLRKGMMIRVTVMVQGKIEHATEPQRINYSGNIGLPLLQNVDVGGKDIESIEAELTTMYSRYYKNPLVNIEFVGQTEDPSQSPWGYITLMGQIVNPGPLAMPPTQTLTISGAVKLSGGMSASANKGGIRIFRPHPEDETVEVIKVDLNDLAKQGKQAEDVSLLAGDVVYIPERIF